MKIKDKYTTAELNEKDKPVIDTNYYALIEAIDELSRQIERLRIDG